jgi:hypothetical protein
MMPRNSVLFRASFVHTLGAHCAREGPFCFKVDATIADDLIVGMLAVARTKMREVEGLGFRDFREGL